MPIAAPSFTQGLQNLRRAIGGFIAGNPSAQQVADEQLPEHIRARLSGFGQAPNLSTVTNDVSRIQAAIRQAEYGDTYQLFALYRDWMVGNDHLQSQMNIRKMVVVGQTYTIQPVDKTKPDDEKACDYIKQMIDDCQNWDTGLGTLMDAALWPVSVVEKIYAPYEQQPGDKFPVRYQLQKLFPVDKTLFCFKLPYLSPGGFGFGQNGIAPNAIPVGLNRVANNPSDTIWDVDEWEPDLRFYSTLPNGSVDRSWANIYAPTPARHVVHRGNLLNGIRDNFGGSFRATWPWVFLSAKVRDWWGRSTERYGAPFTLVKTDVQDVNRLNLLQQALQDCTKLFGLVIDRRDEAELLNISHTDMSTAFQMLYQTCCDGISKIVTGQTTGEAAKSKSGFNGGAAQGVQSDVQVRKDYQQFDKALLGNACRRQIFEPYLKVNGIPGSCKIVWGGFDEEGASAFADRLVKQKAAGFMPTDDAHEHISEKLGMPVERYEEPTTNGQSVGKK